MKKIYGFAALGAAMLLASCSNNDEPIIGGEKGDLGRVRNGYIALNLKAPLDETRANSGDFYIGSSTESNISSGCVICFNTSDKFVSYADLTEANFNTGTEGTNQNIESYKQMEIKVTEQENNKIAKMITVLNLTGSQLGLTNPVVDATTGTVTTAATDIDVDGVRKKLADWATNKQSSGTFVMSTAVCNASAPTYTTPVVAYNDFADATKNHVDVYVERVLARVDYTVKKKADGSSDFNNEGATGFTYDEKTYDENSTDDNLQQLNIVVTGIEYANVASNSYLVKDITGVSSLTEWAENFVWDGYNATAAQNTHRSHWATVAPLTAANADPADIDLKFVTGKSWTTITSAVSNFNINSKTSATSTYMQENTSTKPTCILITAYIDGGTETSGAQKDIYQAVANAKYYTYDNLRKAYASYINQEGYLKEKEDGTGFEGFDYTDIKIDQKDKYSGWIQISSAKGNTVYKKNADPTKIKTENTQTLAEFNTYLKGVNVKKTGATTDMFKYRVYKWEGGACYYYKNIEPAIVGKPGVVRNHYYDLTLNGVKGMGVPVFKKADIIVPETPDPVDPDKPTDVYINATINVLSWTYYTQGIDFK